MTVKWKLLNTGSDTFFDTVSLFTHSLQHQRREIPLENRILHGIEHNLDILCIDGRREVMVDGLRWFQALQVMTVVASNA